jgi:hypothetical protein
MNSSFHRFLLVAKVWATSVLVGLLAWLYGINIQITPEWLSLPISHLMLWLRTDTFTILMFIISAIGFCLESKRRSNQSRKETA